MWRYLITLLPFIQLASLFAHQDFPGRVDCSDDYVVRVGECDVYFFMTKEKDRLTRDFTASINNDLLIENIFADEPSECYAPALVALNHPEKDPFGSQILEAYHLKDKSIMENHFGFQLFGTSLEVNLYYNFESLVFHRDRFVRQYEWLSQQIPPIEKYVLVQDLTVFDWQMGMGTVTGTIVQDGNFGDRYLFCVYPKEVIGTLYTEPAVYLGPDVIPHYPGHVTIPYHTGLAPIDLDGERSCGTSRGKRLSTSVRGLVNMTEMASVRSRCKELNLNRKQMQGQAQWKYDNGIIMFSLGEPIRKQKLQTTYISLLSEVENVTVIEIPAACLFDQALKQLKKHLPGPSSLVKVYRLIKKDGGFSKMCKLGLDIRKSSQIVLVNHSEIPSGHRYFNLAQDFTLENLPWIQFYHFPPEMVMKVTFDTFNKLLLSPVEEILYMDESLETENYRSEYQKFNKKLSTCVDVYVFEN